MASEAMTLCLSDQELRELTGKRRFRAQRRALAWMGIDCRVRPDGSPAVLRSDVDPSQTSGPRAKVDADNEPDWGAL